MWKSERLAVAAALSAVLALTAGCALFSPVHPGEPVHIVLPVEPVLAPDGQCGLGAARTVLRYLGRPFAEDGAPPPSDTLGIVRYLRAHGAPARLERGSFAALANELRAGRPVLVIVPNRGWPWARPGQAGAPTHALVVRGVDTPGHAIYTADPYRGRGAASLRAFLRLWSAGGNSMIRVVTEEGD